MYGKYVGLCLRMRGVLCWLHMGLHFGWNDSNWFNVSCGWIAKIKSRHLKKLATVRGGPWRQRIRWRVSKIHSWLERSASFGKTEARIRWLHTTERILTDLFALCGGSLSFLFFL